MTKVFTLTVIEMVLYHNATLANPATKQLLGNGWLMVKDGRIVQRSQQ
ncbi:hypothetical protein [Pseudoalteromonas xiamenensis]|uniref:Uncharacterized protein n=1 Tax=Pseudoalteromonas xiamenensis TaxID=882626 RepID=A0A975HLV2_9GAMM|nr:hypothetical protein [Pseudoalteromonas xiamenensis]QTH72312.1 hypothetical protein J5O05_05460 [Pseudoalteromonas xiamenensis]